MDKIAGFNFKNAVKCKTVDSNKSVKAIRSKCAKAFEAYDKVVPVKCNLDLEISNKSYVNDLEEWSLNKDIITNHQYAIVGQQLSVNLFKFTTTALKLIGYITTHLTYNSNRIDLNVEELCSKLNVHKRMMYSAIAELDANDVLYRTCKQGIYSINPLCLFKGSLIRFYKLYREKYGYDDVKLDDKGRIIIDD